MCWVLLVKEHLLLLHFSAAAANMLMERPILVANSEHALYVDCSTLPQRVCREDGRYEAALFVVGKYSVVMN